MTNVEIGKKIMIARTDKGMTRKELAEAIHLAPSNVTRYEKGESGVKAAIINEIAKVLDVNPEWILGNSDSKENKQIDYVYLEFAQHLQNIGVSKDDMAKMLGFYELIRDN